MKNIIRMAILCAFLSLYSIQDINVQEDGRTQVLEVQKESSCAKASSYVKTPADETADKSQEIKKMSLYEQAVNIVTSKVFWGGIFKGMFLSAPFYAKVFENFTKKGSEITYQILSDFKPLRISEITSMFKSVGQSAQAYLFQHYSLRHLKNQINEIFNINPEIIVLVTNDNNERSAGKDFICMPFKDAIDITKLKQFLGVLAHEWEHLKNKHYLLRQIFYYACFISLMYGIYKIAVKIRDNAHDTLFEDLFEENQHNKESSQKPDKSKNSKTKIILCGSYFLFLLAIAGGSYWVADNLTDIIGNLTWRNYFERQADSFTHENQHTQKNLLSAVIDFFKSRLTEERKELENSWLHSFFDPHPTTADRITTLSNQLYKIKSQIDK